MLGGIAERLARQIETATGCEARSVRARTPAARRLTGELRPLARAAHGLRRGALPRRGDGERHGRAGGRRDRAGTLRRRSWAGREASIVIPIPSRRDGTSAFASATNRPAPSSIALRLAAKRRRATKRCSSPTNRSRRPLRGSPGILARTHASTPIVDPSDSPALLKDVEPRSRGVASRKRGVGLTCAPLGLAAILAACAQEVSAPPPNPTAPVPTATVPDAGAPPITSACAPSTPSRVRRLSQGEYRRAVQALVGVEPSLLSSAQDPLVHGFDNNAEALAISPGNLEDFALAAELTAATVNLAALAPCASTDLRACGEHFAASFAERAFGRPASSEEVERLRAQYRLGAASENHARGIRLVIETVLVSPHFLYRVEIGSPPARSPRRARARHGGDGQRLVVRAHRRATRRGTRRSRSERSGVCDSSSLARRGTTPR